MHIRRTSPPRPQQQPRTGVARRITILLMAAGSLLGVSIAPATAAGSAHARPSTTQSAAHGNTIRPNTEWDVTLTVNKTQQWPTLPVTFSATVSPSLSGTGMHLFIYDETEHTLVGNCAANTCGGTTTQPLAENDFYIAYVSDPADTTFSRQVAISNEVVVTWLGIGLSLNAQFNANTQTSGGTTVLVATSSRTIQGSPFVIQIWDLTTGRPIGICTMGTVCTAGELESGNTTHAFIASFATSNDTFPPVNLQRTSGTDYVTWTTGTVYAVSLAQGNNVNSLATVVATSNAGAGVGDLEIFNENTGALLDICPTGSSCTASFLPAFGPGTHLVAFLTTSVNDTLPPTNLLASSNTVTVSQS